jgi:transposase
MARQRRTYTREFKIEAVQLLKRSGRTQEDLEQELGLASGALSRWKKRYSEDGAAAFPGRGRLAPDAARLRELERENEILRQERDILKKALTIFSQTDP